MADRLGANGASLDGRRVVVTGGSRGIGAAVVRRLANAGAAVLAAARGAQALEALCAEAGAEALSADVAGEAGIDALTAAVAQRWGAAPDAVVHSAGAFGLAPAAETPLELFDRSLAVNLRAAFLLTRAWLGGMLERGSGHFLFIGSVAGRVALPGNAAYSASKYGLRGLHEVLAVELRGTGVRSTLIEPAATATPLWDAVDRGAYPDLPPREAMLDPTQVAAAVEFALTRPGSVTLPHIGIERG